MSIKNESSTELANFQILFIYLYFPMPITIFNLNFPYSLLIKISFLVILLILTIFLLQQELLLNDKLNLDENHKYKLSSNKGIKTLRDFLFVYIPWMIAYRSLLTNDAEKAKILEEFRLDRACPPVDTSRDSSAAGRDELKLVKSESDIEQNLSYYTAMYTTKKDALNEKLSVISKSSFLNLDFDINSFMKDLSQIELLALGGLLLNYLILSYTITIILILYGDFLIKRFDLDNKYPKLSKFIQLRRKLQGYYLKFSFLWIFLCVLPQIFVNVSILLPKIIELFS